MKQREDEIQVRIRDNLKKLLKVDKKKGKTEKAEKAGAG